MDVFSCWFAFFVAIPVWMLCFHLVAPLIVLLIVGLQNNYLNRVQVFFFSPSGVCVRIASGFVQGGGSIMIANMQILGVKTHVFT